MSTVNVHSISLLHFIYFEGGELLYLKYKWNASNTLTWLMVMLTRKLVSYFSTIKMMRSYYMYDSV